MAPPPDKMMARTTAEIDSMRDFGMVSPDDLMRLQREANEAQQKKYQDASLDSLTFNSAVADAHEALAGVVEDFSGTTDRHSLRDIFTHENRLRGLGILLIALALVGLVVDYILVPIPGSA